jgi:hypothetical protein
MRLFRMNKKKKYRISTVEIIEQGNLKCNFGKPVILIQFQPVFSKYLQGRE